jgi:hypothetical protein
VKDLEVVFLGSDDDSASIDRTLWLADIRTSNLLVIGRLLTIVDVIVVRHQLSVD